MYFKTYGYTMVKSISYRNQSDTSQTQGKSASLVKYICNTKPIIA